MSKRLFFALMTLCLVTPAVAEQTKPGLDAFLQSAGNRGLVDVRGLSPLGQQSVREGRAGSIEGRLGVPTFFWAGRTPAARSLRDIGLTPEQAARRYLFAYGELYRQEQNRIADARVAKVHDFGDGAVIVTFQQDVGGVRVFRDELKVVMNQRLELVALSGYLTPERKALGEFSLKAATAVHAAFVDLAGHPLETNRLSSTGTTIGDYEGFRVDGEATPARARKVYFPLTTGLEPGFYVELQVGREDSTEFDYYSYVVSAHDGRLLYRKNLTANDAFTYRVWADATAQHVPSDGPQGDAPTPHPTGTRNQYNPPYVPSTLVTWQNGPISTNDPWLPSNAADTRGNNASAYADIASPNGFSTGDLRATLTSSRNFDRVYDPLQNPNVSDNQRMAAITQLFYNVNFLHDWFYDKGFNELSGNGQADNYGRGGLANDAMYAEAQDYSGKNNANMSTPSDGAHPIMQMYVFDGGLGALVRQNNGTPRDYTNGSATFGPQSFTVTADVVLVNDGSTSGGGTINDGCSPFTGVVGKLALIDRGLCTFTVKVENAQAAGAVGVIIANNTNGGSPALVGTSAIVTIPSLSVSRTSGTTMKGLLMNGGVLNLTMSRVPVIDRDGTIDNAIVAHEWGHYISNRLIGDGNGISNNQAYGMGEGWGDFHSMLMAVREGDDLVPSNAQFNGVYGMAAYTSYGLDPDGYYFGIRRLPYSTDMSKNGLTFKHIQDGVPLPSAVPTAFGLSGADNSESHNTGEVWATMLWECYAALLRSTPRLTFADAQDRMRGYLVASYKATPLMPTMVEARDAVLAAAAAKDQTDFALFSAAFAKRGMGMKAVAPDRDAQDNKPVIESFITGNDLAVVSVKLDDALTSCDNDGILDNNEIGKLTISLKNVGTGAMNATTALVTTTSPGVTIPNGGLITFPASQPFGVVIGSLEVSLKDVVGSSGLTFSIAVNDPSLAVAGPQVSNVSFRVNYDAKPQGSTVDDVEAPTTVWTSTSDPNGNTGSNWRRFEATATSHYWFGPNPSSPADTWLTSPTLDVGSGNFVLVFKHRWEFEGSPVEYFDGGVIEISINGGTTWTDVGAALSPAYNGTLTSQGANPLSGKKAFVGKSPGYPAFVTQTVDLGTLYAGKAVKLRFRIGADDAAALKGWEIDDLDFTGLTSKPFPRVETDPNLCSNGIPVVTVGADQVVNEGAAVKLTGTATDPDGDALALTWTQTGGGAVTLDANNGFKAPGVLADTLLTFELTAFDGRAKSLPAVHKVLVRNVNERPVVSLTPAELEVNEGADVTLTGMATDGEGEEITGYVWSQVNGPIASLNGIGTATLHFVAPQVVADSTMTFELVAKAGGQDSIPTRAIVHVRNVPEFVSPKVPVQTKGGCGCNAGAEGLVPFLGFVLLALGSRRKRG